MMRTDHFYENSRMQEYALCRQTESVLWTAFCDLQGELQTLDSIPSLEHQPSVVELSRMRDRLQGLSDAAAQTLVEFRALTSAILADVIAHAVTLQPREDRSTP